MGLYFSKVVNKTLDEFVLPANIQRQISSPEGFETTSRIELTIEKDDNVSITKSDIKEVSRTY